MPADAAIEDGDFSRGLLCPGALAPSCLPRGSGRRYGVYRNNVTLGLIRAMEANFPVVRRLLGAVYFAGLAREFVQQHPPVSPLLFHYGADFPAFIEAESDLAAYPYLADVARLEQQLRVSYHAADAVPLGANELARLAQDELPGLKLQRHPAAAIFSSAYAVHDILMSNRDAFEPFAGDPLQPQCVLVTRPHFETCLTRLMPGSVAFVAHVFHGGSFGDAVEQAFASDAAFDLGESLGLVIGAGAFQTLIMLERQNHVLTHYID